MGAQSIDVFFRQLKSGAPAPAYYVRGSEDVLKEEVVRALDERLLDPSLRDFNFDQRSATQMDPDEAVTICQTLPMMASHRLVVLRDVEAWKRKTRARAGLLSYLDRPSPETVVVLVQGASEEKDDAELARRATVVVCDPLSPDRALRWVRREAERLETELAPEAAEHLLTVVGNDLGALRGELAKLAGIGGVVSVELIGELVGVRRGETVYDWRDAVLEGRPERALALLPAVLAQSGVTGVRLVSTLGTTLVGVGVARAHADGGASGRRLESLVFTSLRNARPFGLQDWRGESVRWSRWAKSWPHDRLQLAFRLCLEADQALKSTRLSDERGVLTDLLLHLTPPRREAA